MGVGCEMNWAAGGNGRNIGFVPLAPSGTGRKHCGSRQVFGSLKRERTVSHDLCGAHAVPDAGHTLGDPGPVCS